MRKSLIAAGSLLVMAPVALAMNFQPGYWEITVSGAEGEHTARRCLEQVKPQFNDLQKRFCKRLEYKVSKDTMTSRVHCQYPQSEFTSHESMTFSGDTLHGAVQIDVVKPQHKTIRYTVTGKRLSATCPAGKAAEPATH